jgi:hypothetical protein
VATGREDRDMENLVLNFWCDKDWFERRIAKSMASLLDAGSATDDARRRDGDMGVVGERNPEFDDLCSSNAET